MATGISSTATSVGTSAVALVIPVFSTKSLVVQNLHATQDVYLGGSDVSSLNGLKLPAGQSRDIPAFNGTLYAVASGAATDVRVLKLS